MDGETAALAQKDLGKALLTSEVPLLRSALETCLVGWWLFKIEDLGDIAVAVWEPL